MEKIKINFITGNKNKLREVQAIFAGEFEVVSQSVDIPEIQGEIEDICRHKCEQAALKVGGRVLVEDTCLSFNALHGLPGPYIKPFLDKLGHQGLNDLLLAYEDKSAEAVCTFALSDGPGYRPRIFQGVTKGKIVPARGASNFGWDPIFEYDGET
ncbi:MAG: nucleoside triphosphate pyrophosphohydrolase ham1 [Vezdaea aestivalis]|nr:MAG: nucleoside triphosphate pyrophosphohydrolase ham1 [Vezdaea aestivalis]